MNKNGGVPLGSLRSFQREALNYITIILNLIALNNVSINHRIRKMIL